MTTAETLKEYLSLKELFNEVSDAIEALEQTIKETMGEHEELSVDGISVRWTHYTAHRFDSKAFKEEHAALYEQYVKRTQARRFQVVR